MKLKKFQYLTIKHKIVTIKNILQYKILKLTLIKLLTYIHYNYWLITQSKISKLHLKRFRIEKKIRVEDQKLKRNIRIKRVSRLS